ncbi:MAG: DUF4406 domain-containing protein [Actinobacteria bacterium]|nr:DUF4406 domain-containing protein [Actinomycetota bacterium]
MTDKMIYIAGPMTGYPECNYPAFNRAAADLRRGGWEVVCPAELHPADPSLSWDWYLRRDIAELVKCSDIFMLRGWEFSAGAQLEFTIAKTLGMTVMYQQRIPNYER